MKIENYSNPIPQIQRPVQSKPPVQPIQDNQTKNKTLSGRLPPKQIKPSDVLSKDELSMLKKLFNDQAKMNLSEKSNGYQLDRQKMPITKLGTLIDVKG